MSGKSITKSENKNWLWNANITESLTEEELQFILTKICLCMAALKEDKIADNGKLASYGA